MSLFVVDASVVGCWSLPDEDDPEGDRLLIAASRGTLAVPFHFPAEIGNLILTAERRRRITPEQARAARQAMATLSFDIDPGGFDTVWGAAWSLSVRHGLTLYDALYLELALRLNLPLATFDGALRRAAEAEGLRLA
ncbi:type II toxin-antitoxin system VapC family toxin [Brevundimonas sp.]|uniref:type II toxin-antitoxin system VapC family toxin n=1 Tax=Brevundimonas sp. TaxID=1871086 RepID=UPI003F6EABF5